MKPSTLLATILSLPFACAVLLIAQADLPILPSLLWIALVCFACGYFLTRYVLLTNQNSVCLIETLDADLFIHERSGKRLRVSLSPGPIIHPCLCILTFICEDQELATETHLSNHSGNLHSLKAHFIHRLMGQTRRHVIICRYNASCLREFRRLRVVLKFS